MAIVDVLRDFLPENYQYKIIKCDDKNNNGEEFDIEVRVNVTTEHGVKNFLAEFNSSSGCTFNCQSGRQDKHQDGGSARSRYRGYRKCCMNVSHSCDKENQQPGKNTNCPASINFRLENATAKNKSVILQGLRVAQAAVTEHWP